MERNLLIKNLRNEVGVGIYEASEALNLCKDYEVAKEFLRLYGLTVSRYKIVDGQKILYTKEDYIELAKRNLKKES